MPTAEQDGLDELRRRVYRPDATAEDRARYAALLADRAEPDPEPEPAAPEPAAPVRPRRSRRLLPVAIGAAVAIAVVVGVVLSRSAPAVDGPAPKEVPLTAEQRATFVNALVIGTDAGIAAFLLTTKLPHAVLDASSPYTVEQRGVGSRDLDVLTLPHTDHGELLDPLTQTTVAAQGTVTVLLVVAQSADVGWRVEVGSRPVASRGGFQAAGALTAATIPYTRGHRPDHLRIVVPAGVPWGAAIVYSH